MDVLLIFLPKFSSKHFNTLRFQHTRRAISTLIHWSKIFYIHVNFQSIKVTSREYNCEANLHACLILNIKLKRLADNPIKSTLSRWQQQTICSFASTNCRWQYHFVSMSFSTISELAHVSFMYVRLVSALLWCFRCYSEPHILLKKYLLADSDELLN